MDGLKSLCTRCSRYNTNNEDGFCSVCKQKDEYLKGLKKRARREIK